jgi:hypothetical protein
MDDLDRIEQDINPSVIPGKTGINCPISGCMTYSSFLTSFSRNRDPRFLWPLAGAVSVAGHLLVLVLWRTLVIETTPVTTMQPEPLPIQLITDPQTDPAASATVASSESTAVDKPVLTSEATPTPPEVTPQPRPTPLEDPVFPSPILPRQPSQVSPPPADFPTPVADTPQPPRPRQSFPTAPDVQPPPPRPSDSQPSPPRGGFGPVTAPPVRPVPRPQPFPTNPVEPGPVSSPPFPAPESEPEPVVPAPDQPDTRPPFPDQPITTPPVVSQPPTPTSPSVDPNPVAPPPRDPPTVDPNPVVSPTNPTAPGPTEPVSPPAGSGPGMDNTAGQLSLVGISQVQGGRDFAEEPPKLKGGSQSVALFPMASICGVSNPTAVLSSFQNTSIQVRIQVETSGVISNAWIDDNQGSGNPALDALVMCTLRNQVRLEPATSGGQPHLTNSYILETQLQF